MYLFIFQRLCDILATILAQLSFWAARQNFYFIKFTIHLTLYTWNDKKGFIHKISYDNTEHSHSIDFDSATRYSVQQCF